MAHDHARSYVTAYNIVLLIGVLMVLLSAFGVSVGAVDLFKLGVGVCFASRLL